MGSRPVRVAAHGRPAAGIGSSGSVSGEIPQRGQIDEATPIGPLQRLPVACQLRSLAEPLVEVPLELRPVASLAAGMNMLSNILTVRAQHHSRTCSVVVHLPCGPIRMWYVSPCSSTCAGSVVEIDRLAPELLPLVAEMQAPVLDAPVQPAHWLLSPATIASRGRSRSPPPRGR